jgi:hypothetical protein
MSTFHNPHIFPLWSLRWIYIYIQKIHVVRIFGPGPLINLKNIYINLPRKTLLFWKVVWIFECPNYSTYEFFFFLIKIFEFPSYTIFRQKLIKGKYCIFLVHLRNVENCDLGNQKPIYHIQTKSNVCEGHLVQPWMICSFIFLFLFFGTREKKGKK